MNNPPLHRKAWGSIRAAVSQDTAQDQAYIKDEEDVVQKGISISHQQNLFALLTTEREVLYHNGYPRVAAFNVNEKNQIIRRFGLLRARLLLHSQDQLAEMERQLSYLDDHDSLRRPNALKSRALDESRDKSQSRKELFIRMQQKFRDHGEYRFAVHWR